MRQIYWEIRRLKKDKVLFKITKRRFSFVPYMPYAIYIDATSLCNLNCITCALHTLPKERRGHLSFENFKKILSQFPSHFRMIKFSGMGEPLVNPEIIKMLKYAKEKGFKTSLYTNGTLIDKDNVEQLVISLDSIHFSLDGAKKETYEYIRRGGDFNKVVDNLSLFIHTANKLRVKVYTSINFVACKLNYHEIVGIVDMGYKIGADEVTVNIIRKMYPEIKIGKYEEKIKDLQKMDREVLSRQIQEAREISKIKGIRFGIQPLERRWKKCIWPWWGTFITHDGFVTPCCLINTPSVITFGNIFKQKFKAIWNNSCYRNFRRKLLTEHPPEVCSKCGL